MDLIQYFYSLLIVILIICKDVSTLTLTVAKSGDKAIYGPNQFTLTCNYQLGEGELLYFINLIRHRDPAINNEQNNETIVTYQAPTNLNANATYNDPSLVSRTVASNPTTELAQAKLQFNEIKCEDKATYYFEATYFSKAIKYESKSVELVVKAITIFNTDKSLSFTPQSNIAAGDDVTFTCSGDVGREPAGQLGWYYYLNNDTTSQSVDVSSQAESLDTVESPSTCSYRKTSRLKLEMRKEFNGIVVRCTVQQDIINEFGEGHIQQDLAVLYPPTISPISSTPNMATYPVGHEALTLKCLADSNPASNYYWMVPGDNGTDVMFSGQELRLSNLNESNSGTYTCVAYNLIKSQNFTANTTVNLDVRVTTTPAPTTSTSSSTPAPTKPGGGTSGNTGDKPEDDSNTTTIIIVVLVLVAVIIICAIVGIIIYKKRQAKKPEIEEPPEKPRNNQDLSFHGNRPDLVTSDQFGMKNNQNNHNTSFNNSFDSMDKSRNEDGLNYVDLQFDDKPRSRRPIQMFDNGSMGGNSQYTDISLPRV